MLALARLPESAVRIRSKGTAIGGPKVTFRKQRWRESPRASHAIASCTVSLCPSHAASTVAPGVLNSAPGAGSRRETLGEAGKGLHVREKCHSRPSCGLRMESIHEPRKLVEIAIDERLERVGSAVVRLRPITREQRGERNAHGGWRHARFSGGHGPRRPFRYYKLKLAIGLQAPEQVKQDRCLIE